MVYDVLKSNSFSFVIIPFFIIAFWGWYYFLSARISCWMLKKKLKITHFIPKDLWESGIISFFVSLPVVQAWQGDLSLIEFSSRSLFLFAVCGVVAQSFYLSFIPKRSLKEIFAAAMVMHVISYWLTIFVLFIIPYTITMVYTALWLYIPVS